MRHALCVITTLAAMTYGIANAAAENYVDDARRIQVTIPDGWQQHANKDGPLALGLLSPRFKTTKGLCILLAVDVADTRKMSQAQINEEAGKDINEAFWRAALQDKTSRDVTVESKSEMRGDRRIHRATAHMTVTQAGTDLPLQANFALQFVPGQMLMGNCLVAQEHEATEVADIETILGSFDPIAGGVIARAERSPAPSATLVLHAGPRFDGARRELTQDMPHLFQAGWNVVTGSFNLKGYGLWEICDGMNYQGNCRIISGAESAALGGRAVRIGSARRVVNAGGPRAAVGVANEAVTTGMTELFQRIAAPR